jgi:hypothetical protein
MFPSIFLFWCSSNKRTAMDETAPNERSTVATEKGMYTTGHQERTRMQGGRRGQVKEKWKEKVFEDDRRVLHFWGTLLS